MQLHSDAGRPAPALAALLRALQLVTSARELDVLTQQGRALVTPAHLGAPDRAAEALALQQESGYLLGQAEAQRRPVPVYDPSGGSRNYLGLFVGTAPDARRLHRDCHAILNGLEAGLNPVRADR